MRVPLSVRRSPTFLEQLVGKRRARLLRRRLGLLALGTGVALLKPKTRITPVAVTVGTAVIVMLAFSLHPI